MTLRFDQRLHRPPPAPQRPRDLGQESARTLYAPSPVPPSAERLPPVDRATHNWRRGVVEYDI